MKSLSIIIPMYNVAPYVERCIRSLENQDIPKDEYEIICINDGSPDNCREIIEQLQQEFSNILLINQENKGVSLARNKGIDIAKGKYLLFIDPDDYVKPNILKEKINHMYHNGLDIGLTGYIILNTNFEEEYLYELPFDNNIVMSGMEFSNVYTKGRSEIRDPHRSWAIFFNSNFIKSNKLYYLPGVPYLEDGELIYRILCVAERVSYLAKPFYLRTTRPGSATHSRLFISDKSIKGFIKAARNLKNFQESQSLTSAQRSFLNQPIVKFCLSAVIACSYLRSIHKIFWVHKQLINNNLGKLELSNCSPYHTKIGRYYNKSIYYFLLNYIISKAKVSLNNRIKQRKANNQLSEKNDIRYTF